MGVKPSRFLAKIRVVLFVSPLLAVCISTAVAHEVQDWPTPDITRSSISALPTTTDHKGDLSDKSVLPPIVMPLEWSGGPIEAKVLLIGNHLNYDSRYSYAIVDLFEGVIEIYPKGHHHIADEGEGSLSWASFTPHGDVLIYYEYNHHVVYFVPDGDFSLEPTIIRPRRVGNQSSRLRDQSNPIQAIGDKSRSMVWVSQTSAAHPRDSKGSARKATTWVDLMKVDNSDIVMTVRLDGEYRIVGLLDDSLLIASIKDEIIISSDGNIRRLAACSNYHRDILSPSYIAAVHDQYYACMMDGRLFIMDINAGRLHTLTAPSQGRWWDVRGYIPEVPTLWSKVEHNDNLLLISGWTRYAREGHLDSAYIVSLSEQTVRRVYIRENNRLKFPIISIDSRYIITWGKSTEENELSIWVFDYKSGHWSKITAALDDYHYIYDIWLGG